MDSDIIKIASRILSGPKHTIRTAGTVEFKKDLGPVRRSIRTQDFKWSSDRLRELSKILWACERAHSYAIASFRLFSRMPAADFSPDGLLGGVGYIQSVRDMRSTLGKSIEILSGFCDTLNDEVNANHWSRVSDDPDVQNLLNDTQETKKNPDEFVQEEYESEVKNGNEPVRNPQSSDYNPTVESDDTEDEEDDDWESLYSPVASSFRRRADDPSEKPEMDTHSELPQDELEQKNGVSSVEMVMNTTNEAYASAIRRIPQQISERMSRKASSSVPVDTLSQPRVDHIGPAEGGEFGYFNDPSDWPSDDLVGEGFHSLEPIYEGEDANVDGTDGYSSPTRGDETYLKASMSLAGYSWLPGSRNEKLYNYYDRNLSESDIDWLKAHDEPESPLGRHKADINLNDKDPLFEGYW